MMRKSLDTLYQVAGLLAAASLVGIVVVVFGQVVLNIFDYTTTRLFGVSFGLLIPSYTALSGYGLAFATFLSLGLGLRQAAHIRVTLLEVRLPPLLQRTTLTIITLVASVVGALFTYGLGQLAFQSYQWGDRGTGLLREPLWIPQLVMCVGALVFTIAAIDTLCEVLRRGRSDALATDNHAEEAT
ncbi:TRAP transporter small permease [Castellaniella sp. FW104-16D08]|uniref:TRAP transporter small permease n=1 Tax=unclassified Castellaniella TaxID=2617606 RepID=UPI00331481AA